MREKVTLLYEDKQTDTVTGAIIQMKIWRVADPVRGSIHQLKYSLFYGFPGRRIVGYDNEAGKGDHRHLGDMEMPYTFITVEKMIEDFISDVA